MANILIIEDNEQLADLIGQYLQKKGMTAHIAPDGVNALRYFASGNYDLLLVDLRLPLMNGDEVCRKVRESAKGKNVPIIMMSGYVNDPEEIDRLKKEFTLTNFLVKPFSSEMLYSLISASLQARPAEPARQVSQQPAPIKGDLERSPFEQVLLYLFLKHGTGILTAERDGSSRRFFFLDGAATDVEVMEEKDDFGNYLARKNIANATELQEYENRRKPGMEDPRDIFIKMGCLTPRRFQEENLTYLHDRLLDCFSWKSGTVLFEWGQSIMRSA
ncbi:MAG: response regulator, partial [Nitrospirota bacterium]|nr:response regulator [Nitrospirota bacterium]